MGKSSHSEVVNDKPAKICIIGAGNVATHMARALDTVADVAQICSRHMASARALADVLHHAEPIADLSQLSPDADFYIIATVDDAIASIAASTPDYPGIWAHTSGSVGMDALSALKSKCGVFYPLQTFSKNVDVDFSKVPMFIEGSDTHVAEQLLTLASLISKDVDRADSDLRRRLHLAAVFACNFTNHLWAQADDILRQSGLNIRKLLPLLEVTLDKIRALPPRDAQTGPARRGDTATMQKHLEMLQPQQRQLYSLLSKSIIDTYKKNEQD